MKWKRIEELLGAWEDEPWRRGMFYDLFSLLLIETVEKGHFTCRNLYFYTYGLYLISRPHACYGLTCISGIIIPSCLARCSYIQRFCIEDPEMPREYIWILE